MTFVTREHDNGSSMIRRERRRFNKTYRRDLQLIGGHSRLAKQKRDANDNISNLGLNTIELPTHYTYLSTKSGMLFGQDVMTARESHG